MEQGHCQRLKPYALLSSSHKDIVRLGMQQNLFVMILYFFMRENELYCQVCLHIRGIFL